MSSFCQYVHIIYFRGFNSKYCLGSFWHLILIWPSCFPSLPHSWTLKCFISFILRLDPWFLEPHLLFICIHCGWCVCSWFLWVALREVWTRSHLWQAGRSGLLDLVSWCFLAASTFRQSLYILQFPPGPNNSYCLVSDLAHFLILLLLTFPFTILGEM